MTEEDFGNPDTFDDNEIANINNDEWHIEELVVTEKDKTQEDLFLDKVPQ